MPESFAVADLADADLVAAIERGGAEARVAEHVFCDRWFGRVRRYAQAHLRDAQLAADVTHDVLLVVLDAIREKRVEAPERLGAFVLGTCRHRVWDENRAEARRQRPAFDPTPSSVEEPTLDVFGRMRLEHCVAGLAARELSVVLLTYSEEWPADRIAEALGTTVGNIRVIRHRALARLAACLEAAKGEGR